MISKNKTFYNLVAERTGEIEKLHSSDVEKNQRKFKKILRSVRIGDNKSNKQLSEIENIMTFYKLGEEFIKF